VKQQVLTRDPSNDVARFREADGRGTSSLVCVATRLSYASPLRVTRWACGCGAHPSRVEHVRRVWSTSVACGARKAATEVYSRAIKKDNLIKGSNKRRWHRHEAPLATPGGSLPSNLRHWKSTTRSAAWAPRAARPPDPAQSVSIFNSLLGRSGPPAAARRRHPFPRSAHTRVNGREQG